MTHPPSSHLDDRRHAREVAKHLDRRRVRRRLTLWTLLLLIVGLAASYLRWGGSLGLGGFGAGTGEEAPSTPRTDGPKRCAIRVTATGITVGGKPMTRAEAVAACKATKGVDVLVTGDAPQREKVELDAALRTAGFTDIQFR